MRANPADYTLTAPPTLADALSLMAEGRHTPLAGGTELMVALAAGRLPARPLLSINHLTELRFITSTPEALTLGAGTTFTDIRRHLDIVRDLPLLAQAASWTGSLANQNRGTIGGNLANASPAADSPPALLVYDATLTLISATGQRNLSYRDFHLAYKKTALRPDELLHSITIQRDFNGYTSFIRKVGTRNAQAISKVALAALARMEDGHIADIRLAAASLREVPFRLTETERSLTGKAVTPETIAQAQATLRAEARPIDDIRSTASYRTAVAANLLEEFLIRLVAGR